jgi:hypothetical protein
MLELTRTRKELEMQTEIGKGLTSKLGETRAALEACTAENWTMKFDMRELRQDLEMYRELPSDHAVFAQNRSDKETEVELGGDSVSRASKRAREEDCVSLSQAPPCIAGYMLQ